MKLADHSGHTDIIKAIQLALIENTQLSGEYASPYKSKRVKLTLHPFRLCLVNQAWYLVAATATDQQPKTYRVQRFKTLTRLDTPCIVPADFSMREYFGNAWGVYRGEKSYDVAIQFDPEAAPLVCETTWHDTQKIIRKAKDGSVTLSFTVDGLGEILWWILGWSGRAKIIKPKELRTMVVEQLQKAIQLNEAE